MVYPFPDFLVYTKSCKEFAEKVNAAGGDRKDRRQTVQLHRHVRTGRPKSGRVSIDMSCLPAAFYARGLPENEAISTSNSDPPICRSCQWRHGDSSTNLHQKHMNMKYLGWVDSGVKFHHVF